MDKMNDSIEKLIVMMTAELGRMPTEEEVMGFIYGDEAKRLEILNNASKE